MANHPSVSRHIPQRTCIVCRQKRPKWELIRIVRTPQGAIDIDIRGKQPGRGAYLCTLRDCWETGVTKKKLDRALKAELTPEQRAKLAEYGRTLSSSNRTADCPAEYEPEGVPG